MRINYWWIIAAIALVALGVTNPDKKDFDKYTRGRFPDNVRETDKQLDLLVFSVYKLKEGDVNTSNRISTAQNRYYVGVAGNFIQYGKTKPRVYHW